MAPSLSPTAPLPTRVLLLTQWFEPEPTFKGLTFARALIAEGLQVEVVTGFPNYPGGKLYSGYRIRAWQREAMQGVPVLRLPLYPSHDNSAIKRVLNYLSFCLSTTLYGLCKRHRPQVIYAYHPPLTVALAAVIIGAVRRVPVVIDIQDMWPDTLRATGMLSNPRVLGVVSAFCRWVYRRADHIVVLSDGFRRLLLERGVPAAKVEVIRNWCDEAALAAPQGSLPAGFPSPDRFRILFAGNMGKAQALDAVLDTAELLRDSEPHIVFVMLGGGVEVERLKAAAAARGLLNVVFLPPVPMSEVGFALAAAETLLVHLKRDPLFTITIPSKTQAYMAIGRPVLMAVEGDAAALVQEAGCGVLARSEDATSIARAARELATMPAPALAAMGENARHFYRSQLALAVGAGRFARLFETLAARRVATRMPRVDTA